MSRLRVLLIAEAANPEWVSVPLEGWSHARAISRIVDAHLVTQVRNREGILRAGLVEGRDVTFIDSEKIAGPMFAVAKILRGGKSKAWTLNTAFLAIAYRYFEWLVWRKFAGRLKRGEFDLVHRLTPLSPTAGGSLARRCASIGVPFVVGPLNGGVPWPADFDSARRAEREWLSYVRGIYKLLPGPHSTLKHASAIIAGSRDTERQLPRKYAEKTHYVPENGIDPARFTAARTRRPQRPLRCVFVGRLVPYKGPDMLIEAAAPLLKSGDITLDILGDGPLMPALRDLVHKLDLNHVVRLPGWIEHTQLADWLINSDLLTFPSIREFGGAVILEAMALGVVPIVMNYGGPGELVTAETGFLLPMGTRNQITASLREAIADCAKNPDRLQDYSRAAAARVRENFTWDAKARQALSIYRHILAREPVASRTMGVSPISVAPSFQTLTEIPCTRHGRDARGTGEFSILDSEAAP